MARRNLTQCCKDDICTMPEARWHGTEGGYGNHRCRCEPCREAHRLYYLSGPGRRSKGRYRAKLSRLGIAQRSSLSSPVYLRKKGER